MSYGIMGGDMQAQGHVQVLSNMVDFEMNIQEAIGMPDFVNRNGPTDLEKGTGLVNLVPILEAMGHKVRIRPMTSGLQAIMRMGDRLTGGADPRREGVALGD